MSPVKEINMNAKKAKRIRQELRRAGVDIKDARYESDVGQLRTDAIGEKYFTPGTVRLISDCGRAVYKRMKAAA